MVGPTLIIGATGGLGRALTHRLAAAGRPVFLIARRGDALKALADDVGAGFAVADAMDEAALREAVGAATSSDGKLSGLAYCVGSIPLKPLKTATTADFLEHFRLNALGAVLAVQTAQQPLTDGRGSVVLVSTVAVQQGFPNHSVIAAAKGAVEGLTRSLAAELAPHIRVNAIAPSLTQTKMAEGFTRNPQMAKAIAAMHAIPRLGEAEDIAACAAFLLSPESGWITGQIMGVDGGRSTLRIKG